MSIGITPAGMQRKPGVDVGCGKHECRDCYAPVMLRRHLYSRVPAAAIRREVDGHDYAWIPHRWDGATIVENFSRQRMVRFTQPQSFIENGEAFVWFASLGGAIPLPGLIPFGVTIRDEVQA